MKLEKNTEKSMGNQPRRDRLRIWSRLQARMTLSFVMVSVATALFLELLLILAFVFVIARLPFVDTGIIEVANSDAQVYALEASVQAAGGALDPRTTFSAGQATSLAAPNEVVSNSNNNQPIAFALLVTPQGQVLASSDPAHHPASQPVSRVLPNPKQAKIVQDALTGEAGNVVIITDQGHVAAAAQPVLNKQKQPIGAIYVQLLPSSFGGNIFSFAGFWLFTGLFWLVLTAPVGALFGMLTTRGLVRRLHRLNKATARFAEGDYSQRVPVSRKDEIGQLEGQFNSMAEQLVESIAQQKALTEHQARLEERARIEQELRTAQYIQRALLPKEVPTLPGWQLVPVYHPAREVGGDFYDFLPTQDGRLGIVIGDATDKGVSAALLMATTCTMLRTATKGAASPGEVLGRVNDLLADNIPSGVFVTCFYAMLDPVSGRICYANAGHDLPYLRHEGKVSELYATGMPLGLMPGSHYEEKDAVLTDGDNLLLYSDGLVEAHNDQREMFSFSYLATLLQEDVAGKELIDFLLQKLALFTGPGWEQEDDVTLVTVRRCENVS